MKESAADKVRASARQLECSPQNNRTRQQIPDDNLDPSRVLAGLHPKQRSPLLGPCYHRLPHIHLHHISEAPINAAAPAPRSDIDNQGDHPECETTVPERPPEPHGRVGTAADDGRVSQRGSTIQLRLWETENFTWNKYRLLSNDIAECFEKIKNIRATVQLIAEAERQRKLTMDIMETEFILAARSPTGKYGHLPLIHIFHSATRPRRTKMYPFSLLFLTHSHARWLAAASNIEFE
ncbi:hypothetical protein C8R44DRAFT_730650 [Mycena epipterygia]|nr:hypothetical protein C8R44DRAFT_730650 [Mycena epipterygia]